MQNNRNGGRVSALPPEPPRRGRGDYDDRYYDDRYYENDRRSRGDDRYDDRYDSRDSRYDDRYDDRRDDQSGRESFGEATGDKRRRLIRAHRVLVSVLLTVMILFNAGYALFSSMFNKMTIVDQPQQTEFVPTEEQLAEVIDELGDVSESDFQMPEGTIMSDKDVEIVLVVGCDLRPDVDGGKGRSDTLILAFIDRVHKKIKLASIMRDLWAPMAGVKGSNKINYAYYLDTAWGNTDIHITRNTIQNCFGIQIDHFVCVNFQAFRYAIEGMGGMDVKLTADEAKYFTEENKWLQPRYKGHTEAGIYNLNGVESLVYCRMRYVGEGDFDRTRRQQYFIGLVLDRIKNDVTIPMMIDIFNRVLPYISTDFTEGQMLGYIAEAPSIAKYEMVSLTFPMAGAYRMGWATLGGTNVSVLLTNYEFLAKAMNAFIYEDDMTYVDGAKASGVHIPTLLTSSFTTTTEFIEQPTDPPAENPPETPPETQPDPPAETPAG